MRKFRYHALKNNTQIIQGEVEAASLMEARAKIRDLGFVPTKVYMESSHEASIEESSALQGKLDRQINFLSLKDKISFTRELQIMLSSGITILDALNMLAVNSPSEKIRKISNVLQTEIMSGKTFAEALNARYAKLFGPVYTGLTLSGETSGELDTVLERVLELLKKQDEIKGKVIQASIYPAILILIMFVVLVLFAKVIFPAFASVFTFNGADVPFLARTLFELCNFISNFWYLIIASVVGGSYLFKEMIKDRTFKCKVDSFLMKIPVVSEFINYINLSNFISVLQVSYDSGVPILEGLKLATKTIDSSIVKTRANKSLEFIKNGRSLSESFSFSSLLPNELIMMIATGEKSGTLGKMLLNVSNVIDKKVNIVLETLTKMFEPILIVSIGAFVLFVAVAFYQMYFGMLGTLF